MVNREEPQPWETDLPTRSKAAGEGAGNGGPQVFGFLNQGLAPVPVDEGLGAGDRADALVDLGEQLRRALAGRQGELGGSVAKI
jgi:hypothetical protein